MIFQRVLIGMIVAYQKAISPFLPDTCRFYPSCSEFARQALASEGLVRGTWLALRRVGRCHPWGSAGYDPVEAHTHHETVSTSVEGQVP